MKRFDVPGGGYFVFRDISGLTSDHQEEYLDLGDRLRDEKRAALAALPPVNPAVMPDPADEAEVRLTRKETGPIQELVLSWILEDSSYGVPLPKPLPLLAANVLRIALADYFSALNGVVPKESPEPGSTSGGTSPDPAPAPLPE